MTDDGRLLAEATLDETRRFMKNRLKDIVPQAEIDAKAEVAYAIRKERRHFRSQLHGTRLVPLSTGLCG